MRIKILAVLFIASIMTSCYSVPAKIGLSPERMEFEAEGGSGSATYVCIMGIDYGYEVTEGATNINIAEIKSEKNNTFYIEDEWVSAVINGESKTIDVTVSPNDGQTSREYKIAVWCADLRAFLTIYQKGSQ